MPTSLLDFRFTHSDELSGRPPSCLPFPRSWDIRWTDLGLLLRFKFRDFHFRRERRLFDMIDTRNSGYVTLDELISFRDKHDNGSESQGQKAPDISRSLLALYHFDVALDGHFTFEEFLLLQAYLQDVEHDSDVALVCRCIPANWLKSSFWRKKLRALCNKPRKGQCRKREELEDEEGGKLMSPMSSTKKRVTWDGEERIITRRKNIDHELQEVEIDEPEADLEEEEAEQEALMPTNSTEEPADSRGPGRHGFLNRSTSDENLQMRAQGESAGMGSLTGGVFESMFGSTERRASQSDEEHEGEEEEEEDEDQKELSAAKEERQRQRSAMLVQALKSNRGRKRFIDWLFRIADSTESDSITMDKLVTFLKAIHADGINPEVFVDPSEDYGLDLSEAKQETSPKKRRGGVLDRSHPQYIEHVGSRIMTRYNEGNTGILSREEFMQLATLVEREYELSDNNVSSADRVGPYRFIRTLGRGAEGVVKLAINTEDESGGKIAVKIIKRGNIASMSRIDKEIEAMVMLDHPTVVACMEVIETESTICLILEYCAGGHIQEYISPTRPMTEAAARFYFTQLIDGLSYCHDQCVCHRDLRIENLMLDNKGDLKITDFGHAGIFQHGWDVFQTMMVGSVSHLAPEQVLGTVYSGEKIDMWSVGVILYIMVTGCPPFVGDDAEELLEQIKVANFQQVPEGIDVPPECQEIFTQLMQAEYQNRPACSQIKEMDFMKGAREKLVLAHCEFFINFPRNKSDDFIEEIRSHLEDADTEVRDPKTTQQQQQETGIAEEEEITASVRTVSDDEDILTQRASNMRPVSMTVFHCVHRTHGLVFKVLVTMLSKDGGIAKLYPLVEFDLQSGEAGTFQKIYRKVKGRYTQLTKNTSDMGYKAVVDIDNAHLEEEVPLAAFAAATGLNRTLSYSRLVKPDGTACQDQFSRRGRSDSNAGINREVSSTRRASMDLQSSA